MSTSHNRAEAAATAFFPITENLDLFAADGRRLAAEWWLPEHPVGVIIVNSALGVARGFYRRYARFLAEQQCAVLLYDYRGIGDSTLKSLRRDNTRFQDWGCLDMPTAIAAASERFSSLPLYVVGHSAGAALLGLAHNVDRLSGVLAVASPSAYWKCWALPQRLQLFPFWHLLIPVLSPIFGYFPGQWLGMGALPRGVVQQWRRWAMHADYIVDEHGKAWRPYHHRLTAPMRFLHFADDSLYAPRASIEHLASFYSGTTPHIVTVSPQDYQVKSIGHFGYFRSAMQGAWWPDVQHFFSANNSGT